jgi:hypothetical protein
MISLDGLIAQPGTYRLIFQKLAKLSSHSSVIFTKNFVLMRTPW